MKTEKAGMTRRRIAVEKILVGADHPASGRVLKSKTAINFLGSVDKKTGIVGDHNHELHGRTVKDTVLVFPSGAGSSVGAYTIYALRAGGAAPLAMVCQRADLTVATGCAVAGIPLVIVDAASFAALSTGQSVTVDAGNSADRAITIGDQG